MATKKYLTKYARGSRQLPDVQGGLRAMQIQGDRQTKALANLRDQQRQADQAYITGLDRAARLEEENRELVRKIEVETPEKLRNQALKNNNTRQQENFKRQIEEKQNLADVWGALSPTLARSVSQAIGSATEYFQTEAGIAEYNQRVEDGTIGSITKVHQKIKSDVDFQDLANQRFNAIQSYLKTGNFDDKQLYDYLSGIDKLHNPVAKEMFYLEHVKQFDGFERDFRAFLNKRRIPLNKKTVVGLYQFRVHELMKQYGINPNSEIGLKLQNFYRQKGFAAEHQLTLGDDYQKNTEVINGFKKRMDAISISNDTVIGDPKFKESVYNRKNAEFINVISAINARPIQNSDGSYSLPIVPNIRANIVGWAQSEMANYNNLQTFLEQAMGATAEHPDGYMIPGADKDTAKNRIFSKFPNLKQELTDDFYDVFLKKVEKEKQANKARQQSEALKYQKRMNDGYYKENPDAFFEDWEATNGNSYAREIFAGSLGFKSEYIDEYTLTSSIVQNYREGNIGLVYNAWAALPDEQNKIGFIYNDLNDLAVAVGKEFQDLDDHIKTFTKAEIEEVEKKGVLDKSTGPTAATMHELMASEILKRYANDRKGTPLERYGRAQESVKRELGYVNGELSNFDGDGYRGSGMFRQKQGKSGSTNKIIFTRFAGVNYGNISSFEIADTLGDTKGQTRVEGLVDLVAADMGSKNPTINSTHLYTLLTTGKTNNALLSKLMERSILKGVQKEDFVNTLKNTVDADAKTKKAVMQWGGDKWCEHNIKGLAPSVAGSLTNDQKTLQMCVESIERQFDIPAWKFLLDAKNRKQLQN